MTLSANVQSLATRVGNEAKALRTLINGNAVDLAALNTTAKSNLVAAVNELVTAIAAIPAPVTLIDDTSSATTKTWSASKIAAQISSTLNAVLAGAPAALDTLNELAAAIGNDASFSSTVTTALGNRVRFDAAQTLTSPQKAQALANIGAADATAVGDTAADFVATFNTAIA